MKKYLILLFIFLSSLTVYSCKNCGCRADKNKTAEHKHENDSHSHAKIDISKSKVKWKGAKIGGSHEGTINIISAHLHFNDREFEGGDVIIDMKSINCTDLSGDSKDNIEGHLKSNDFFASDEYPVSKLEMTQVTLLEEDTYLVVGDLTIRGVTQPIEFKAKIADGIARVKMKVDRTKFNVKYASKSYFKNLGDKIIYDELDLDVNISYVL